MEPWEFREEGSDVLKHKHITNKEMLVALEWIDVDKSQGLVKCAL